MGNDVTCENGETGPVGAELKLHGDASHDTHDKGDGEDPGPEAGCRVVELVLTKQIQRFEDYDEQSQPHRQLRKEIVKADGEGKLSA